LEVKGAIRTSGPTPQLFTSSCAHGSTIEGTDTAGIVTIGSPGTSTCGFAFTKANILNNGIGDIACVASTSGHSSRPPRVVFVQLGGQAPLPSLLFARDGDLLENETIMYHCIYL
jgi:hypothetical protein